MVETVESTALPPSLLSVSAVTGTRPRPMSDITLAEWPRLPIPIGEFDRVLGGGIVPGSLVLIGGDPGIGKSTLLLQICGMLAARDERVLYVAAEESAQQVKLRADRLGLRGEQLYVLAETNVGTIISGIQEAAPKLVVVDSIQTVYDDDLSSGPGSVSQVRDCTLKLMQFAKANHVPIMLVG